MKRENLPAGSLLVVGLLLTGGAVAAKYSSLIDAAPPDVAHLIGLALGESDPPLPHGDSVLSSTGVIVATAHAETMPEAPGLGRRLYSGPWGSAGEFATETQPVEWARQAATRDPAALRAWLGWAVLPVAATDGDTVRVRMYRLRFDSGCPLIDRIDATLSRPSGGWETKLVRVEGGCWT